MTIDIPIETADRAFCNLAPMGALQDRIQAAMSAAGIGQSELARRIGIKQPSVNALLQGNAQRTQYILDISRALHVSAEWLQYGTGGMHSGSPTVGEYDDVFDEATLKLGLSEVEAYLVTHPRKTPFPPERKTDLILAVCRIIRKTGAVEPEVLEQLVRIAS